VLGLPSANHRMRNLPTSPSRRRGEDQLLRHRQEEEVDCREWCAAMLDGTCGAAACRKSWASRWWCRCAPSATQLGEWRALGRTWGV